MGNTRVLKMIIPILQALFMLPLLAQAQEQTGFISIDCGISGISRYTDAVTNISYSSDSGFIESGEDHDISPEYKRSGDSQQLANLRSFPEGTRNCYTLKPNQGKGTKFLIRARFMYGNYDGKLRAPSFDLYIGPNLWTNVFGWDSWRQYITEIIYISVSDHINVCLVNTGNGIPYISSLELRPIGNEIYLSEAGTLLTLGNRVIFSSTPNNRWTRFKDDIYDRMWNTYSTEKIITTNSSSEGLWYKGDFEMPIPAMTTAFTGNRSSTDQNINLDITDINTTSSCFLYMHFAELESLQSNQTRQFNIFVNDGLWFGPVEPSYLSTNTIRNGGDGSTPKSDGTLKISLNNTESATEMPIMNAIELYFLIKLPQKETNQTEVETIWDVKSFYGLKRHDWQGDPCAPETYRWSGINCSYDSDSLPRIISLTLSSSGLSGEIAPSIANLTMLQSLDLSNNNLTGAVPEFLADFPFLTLLNLKGNSFTGQVPERLSSKKDLELILDDHLITTPSCSSGSCGKKKSIVVPLVSALGGVFLVILITLVVFWSLRRKRKQSVTDIRVKASDVELRENDEEVRAIGSKQHEFTFSEILVMTNNFQRVLGKGGFGTVYHGFLNGNEVAVKILSSPTVEGHRQFIAELKILLRVHHKNLTTLVGYCNEGTNVGLIYEYMVMGNLQSHISGSGRRTLSWEDRLRIAIDAAQGLEYLHDGCKPPIIHRDVKSTNILLNEKLQAKLGDFGLSKIFPSEADNHITASIAGTPGYLDPEYCETSRLNEKTDVYSFGVVLLEIITGQPVLTKTRENSHIIETVRSMIATGDVRSILDPKLGEDCDTNSVWRAIEIAMLCVSKTLSNRPTMSWVTSELKDCFSFVFSRKAGSDVADISRESRHMVSEFSPKAR